MKKGRGQGHVTPEILRQLNVYSFKNIKATDFKFDKRVSRVSGDMTLNFMKGAWPGSRDPVNFTCIKCI